MPIMIWTLLPNDLFDPQNDVSYRACQKQDLRVLDRVFIEGDSHELLQSSN